MIDSVASACPLCGEGSTSRPLLQVRWTSPYNPRRSDPCHIDVVRCGGCSLLRLDPRPDDASLDRIQRKALGDSETEVGSFETGNTNTRYPDLLAREMQQAGFSAGGHVLDIGCGSGDLLAAVCDRLDARGTGLEMADESLVRARTRFPRHDWVTGLLLPDHIPEGAFDAVTLIHVLEHLTDPVAGIETIFRGLRPGGILIIEVPNGEFYFSRAYSLLLEAPKRLIAPLYRFRGRIVPFTARGFYAYHLTLFGSRTLAAMVKKAGFEVVSNGFSTSRLEFWLEQNRQKGQWLRLGINRIKLAMARRGLGDNLFLVARRPG